MIPQLSRLLSLIGSWMRTCVEADGKLGLVLHSPVPAPVISTSSGVRRALGPEGCMGKPIGDLTFFLLLVALLATELVNRVTVDLAAQMCPDNDKYQ
jgi:hypothetical protein